MARGTAQFRRDWLFVRLEATVPLVATAHFAPKTAYPCSGRRKLRFTTSWAGEAPVVVWVVFLNTAIKL